MNRVAYICADPGAPVFGTKGCSVHVQEMVRTMRTRGCRVELFAVRTGGPPPADLADVLVHPLPSPAHGSTTQREQTAQQSNAIVRSLLTQSGPYDLIYERHSLWSCAAMELAAELDTPSLLEVNAPLIEEQRQHRELVDVEGACVSAQRAFRAAGAVAAVSAGVADYVESFGVDRRRVHVVPNGVDAGRFAPPARSGEVAAPRPFTVGFVGTMKPWHGLETLVAAFEILLREHASANLLLVGDGPYRATLEAWRDTSDRGLQARVRIVGAVASSEVPRYLAEMDAAVLCPPALANYYFSPLKLFEYMAAGLPVVASGIGQIDEVVEDRVHGLLVPPGDPVSLANALAELAADVNVRTRLGRAARARVLERHTWQAVLDRLATLVPCPWQRASCNAEAGAALALHSL